MLIQKIMAEQITLHQLFSNRIDVKTKDEKRFTLKVCESRRKGRYAVIVYDKYYQRNISVIETHRKKVVKWFDSELKRYTKGDTIVIDKINIDTFREGYIEPIEELQLNIEHESIQDRRIDQAL